MFACGRDLMFSAVQAAAFFERVANHSATKRAALYTSPRSRTAVVQRRLAERRPARAAVAAGSSLDPLHAKSVRKLGIINDSNPITLISAGIVGFLTNWLKFSKKNPLAGAQRRRRIATVGRRRRSNHGRKLIDRGLAHLWNSGIVWRTYLLYVYIY